MMTPEEHRRRHRDVVRAIRAEWKRKGAAIAALETLKPTWCTAQDVQNIFLESCRKPAQPAFRHTGHE